MSKVDIQIAVIAVTLTVPFVFMGLFSAPWWAWMIWIAWHSLIIFANKPERRPSKRRKFTPFKIDPEVMAELDEMEESA